MCNHVVFCAILVSRVRPRGRGAVTPGGCRKGGGKRTAEVGPRPKWIFGRTPAGERAGGGGNRPSRARGRTPPTRNSGLTF
eukprot:scaffold153952_cov32-Tisochrysis_lutea.AAC.1